MVSGLRKKYNEEFTEAKYEAFINDLRRSSNNTLDFRVSETPLFIGEPFLGKLVEAANSIAYEILEPRFREKWQHAMPQDLVVPNEDEHPQFLQVDLAVTKDANGELMPQLIELQGFPSLYAYQTFLGKKVKEHFDIPENYVHFFNGIGYSEYEKMLRNVIVDDADPENVILLEIDPDIQKTRIDFYLTEQMLGIKTVDIRDVVQRGNKLFYKQAGKEIPVERIYNRVIFDELLRKGIEYNFDFKADLDVKWVTHPNWFYRISKYILPLFNNKYVPDCYYLNELTEYPGDLENYVLKPLFSFAGSGVKVDVTRNMLDDITDRENYILQRKVEYEPVIETPDEKAKAEIRMMFLWEDEPVLVNNLLRTGKGKMMGVDYNKNKTWIGANIAFHR